MAASGRSIAGLVLVLVILLVAWVIIPGPTPIVQPIAYNHNLHVEQEGLVCTDCHTQVEERSFATIPSRELCEDCHDADPLGDSAEEARLIAFIEAGEEIPWRRLYEVPDHVYFSHRRHVALGELECAVCHGEVSSQVVPPSFPEEQLTMEWCVACHKSRKVTNDCLACHR